MITHFMGNIPSIVLILLANVIFFGIKEIFVDRKSLSRFEQRLREDSDKENNKLKAEIDKLEEKLLELQKEQSFQYSSIAKVEVTLTHMADTLMEIKDYLFKRNRKKD